MPVRMHCYVCMYVMSKFDELYRCIVYKYVCMYVMPCKYAHMYVQCVCLYVCTACGVRTLCYVCVCVSDRLCEYVCVCSVCVYVCMRCMQLCMYVSVCCVCILYVFMIHGAM